MTILQVADLRFGYGADTLFEKITFSLSMGDRVSLVAPNGAGKSTLLRLVAKELEPDEGTVVIRKESRLGYYRQSHEVRAEGTVLDAFLARFTNILELREELQKAQQDAAKGDTKSLDALTNVTDRYHLAGGDALEQTVAMIAGKLGFSDHDLERPVASLSGGERGRLILGVVLAEQPELLLLDEPTNHLDLDTIGWLETFVTNYRGAVLVVSHDREFLDRTCPKTMELGSKGLRIYPLPYSQYAVAREGDLERERGLVSRQQALVQKTEDFIRKNIAGQKTKQAQSRRKMLDKMDRLENPEDVWQMAERVAFRFSPSPRSGDIVLDCQGVGAERGGRKLFSSVELLVRRGERIGIVGPNGSGKTTLLKILAGRAGAEDRGTVRRGTNLAEGYFDQHLGEVDPRHTAVEEVRSIRGDYTVEAARQYLARFRFWGDDPLRKVSGFSGGERARLALGKLLLEPRNLLFLDEPTNHLDIPATEILEEALTGFEGTVILVSHDRRFLETVTTRIVSVRHGIVDIYPGGFGDFLIYGGEKPKSEERDVTKKKPPPDPQGEERAAVYEAQRVQSRNLEKKRKRVQELEALISSGEKELSALRLELKTAPGDHWEKLAQMASAEQSLTQRLESMMGEWAKLSEELS